jgi:hypothetical protein
MLAPANCSVVAGRATGWWVTFVVGRIQSRKPAGCNVKHTKYVVENPRKRQNGDAWSSDLSGKMGLVEPEAQAT